MSRSGYWQRACRLTVLLLVLWAVITFVINWFAPELNAWEFLGFPLGFYMAAQGDLLVFLGLVWIYNRQMDVLERQYDIDE